MDLRVELGAEEANVPEPRVIWFGRRRVPVKMVLDRWWGRDRQWWKVQTAEGVYVLRLDEGSGMWDLAAVVRT